MPVQLKVDVRDEEVRTLLGRLQTRMDDLTPALKDVGEVILESIQRNIREGRSPEGKAWRPSIRAAVEGGVTLRDTSAHLYNRLHVVAESDRVAVSADWEFAHVHQFGAVIRPKEAKALRFQLANGQWVTTKKVVIPPRPFMGVRDEDWGEIHDTLMEHLLEGSK
jgi:phage gpG-like protein